MDKRTVNIGSEKEIEEVKEFDHYRREYTKHPFCKNNPFDLILMISGIVLFIFAIISGTILLTVNSSLFNELIPYFIVCFLLGLIFSVVGGFAYHKSKKLVKGYPIKVVSQEEGKYGIQSDDYRLEYIDNNVVLHSQNKVEEKKFVNPLADLEDEDEVLGYNDIKVSRTYEKFQLTYQDILDGFIRTGKRHHVDIDRDQANSFLSHLAYSRLLFVKMKDGFSKPFFDTLHDSVSPYSYLIDCEKMTGEEELIDNPMFNQAFKESIDHPDDFVFVLLDNLRRKPENLFGDFLPAIYDKNNKHKVRTLSGKKDFQINPNLFFVLLLNEKETGLENGYQILNFGSLISMDLSSNPTTIIENENKRILSLSDFRHIIELQIETKRIDEKGWNKIDILSLFVDTIKPYRIENDIRNDIEQEAALYLTYLDDQDRIMDEILSSDLLPSILDYVEDDADKVFDFFQDKFLSEYSLEKTESLFRFVLKEKGNMQ